MSTILSFCIHIYLVLTLTMKNFELNLTIKENKLKNVFAKTFDVVKDNLEGENK